MSDSYTIPINVETITLTSDLSLDHNLTGENQLVQEFDKIILKKRRQSYPVSKKREMIELIQTAERSHIKNPIAYIAKESEIDRKILAKWVKESNTLSNIELCSSTRKIHHGPSLKYETQEKEVLEWVIQQRNLNLPVSNKNMASFIMKNHPGAFSRFSDCLNWTYDMMKRNNLSIRRKTHDAKSMNEEELGSIHLDYVTHIRHIMDTHGLQYSNVINMDETGCYFDMAPNTTVNIAGQKHVNIKTTGNSNHCTVFLAVALNGAKLKPLVVFKGKVTGSVASKLKSSSSNYDPRVHCCVQEKAYCDESIMKIWIEHCFKLYVNTAGVKQLSLLMMDNFSPHQLKSVRDQLAENICILSLLPANMTSKLQILDVGINKPFKDYMKAQYTQFLIDYSIN